MCRREGEGRIEAKKGCEGDISKREQMAVAKIIQRRKRRDNDPKGNKERRCEGDRSCRLSQGIMVLLHFLIVGHFVATLV